LPQCVEQLVLEMIAKIASEAAALDLPRSVTVRTWLLKPPALFCTMLHPATWEIRQPFLGISTKCFVHGQISC
jgi:hypothetical protein